jgi:hypothetical protein
MTEPRQCANCKASLPADYPADNRYCAACTAKWQRGPATQKRTGTFADEAAQTVAGHCANCKAPLPPDHPADNPYCASCSARWWAGRAATERLEAADRE